MSAILGKLDEVGAAIRSHGRTLEALVQRDQLLTHVHERLAHLEAEAHERLFVEPLARKAAPILRRLCEHIRQLDRAVGSLPEPVREHSAYYWARQAFAAARVELEALLADFGIDVFVADGDGFDRSRQEAVERVSTSQPSRVGTIARRVAPGLRIGDRVVIAERVKVFVTPS